jgi:hypothetical protein
MLFEVCNTGQGRSRCARFPKDSTRDAVRFHVTEDLPDRISVLWVFERECWPAESGAIQFLVDSGLLDPMPDDPTLAAQAKAFARTYVRRRDGAATAG